MEANVFHVVLCFKMHHFRPEMQSKRWSTSHGMLNLMGPNAPLQARMPTSSNPFTEPNHFEEELAKEKGLPRDLPEDRTEIEVLLDKGGGSIRMST